jgi:hypothetical protein
VLQVNGISAYLIMQDWTQNTSKASGHVSYGRCRCIVATIAFGWELINQMFVCDSS